MPVSHGLAHGNQQTATEPLHCAPAYQRLNGAGLAHHHRGAGEQQQAGSDQGALAHERRQPHTQGDDHCQPEHVGITDPRQLCDRGVQLAGDIRVGDGGNKHVHQVQGKTQ